MPSVWGGGLDVCHRCVWGGGFAHTCVAPGFAKKSKKKEEEQENENWVQCDKCQKWRLLPAYVNMEALPDVWACDMNSYDLNRNTCVAAEQTVEDIKREAKAKLAALPPPQQPHTPHGAKSPRKAPTGGATPKSHKGAPQPVQRQSTGGSVAPTGVLPATTTTKPAVPAEDMEWVQCEKCEKVSALLRLRRPHTPLAQNL